MFRPEGARNTHAIRFRSLEPILADLVAPSELIRGGEFPRVNPGLSFLGHFGPQIGNVQITESRFPESRVSPAMPKVENDDEGQS
jgi:hypothetical protein